MSWLAWIGSSAIRWRDLYAVVLLPRAGEMQHAVAAAAGEQTVLVVDDEPQVRRLPCSVPARAQYRTVEAGDGAQALDLFKQHSPRIDLVLLDMVMPVMHGVETSAI